MTTLLSIDPGKEHFGWAIWLDEVLRHCGRSNWDRHESLDLWIQDTFQQCAIELPQVYQQRRWKGDPNDLIQVAVTVGALLSRVRSCEFQLVKPHQWKGSVPKAVMGERIISKLAPDEMKMFKRGTNGLGAKKHDVIDAIGLGLWKLSRLHS